MTRIGLGGGRRSGAGHLKANAASGLSFDDELRFVQLTQNRMSQRGDNPRAPKRTVKMPTFSFQQKDKTP